MTNNHDRPRYFLQQGDRRTLQDPAPEIYPDSRVSPLLNAKAYYDRLSETLRRVGRHSDPHRNGEDFIYISGFLVNLVHPDDPLTFNSPYGPVRLLDLLVEKARSGVDIRILIWVSWALGLVGKLELRPENIDNLRTIHALREEPSLAEKVRINLLPHPAGSAHTKLVLIGTSSWAAGFTGGIDLSPDRLAPGWLDVQPEVEGPAVQGMLDFFVDLWNQNLSAAKNAGRTRSGQLGRPARFKTPEGWVESVLPGTRPIPPRKLEIPPAGDHLVQSLRTLPRFSFAPRPIYPRINVAPLPSAPRGLFEVKAALQKAFFAAEQYIYIEDQYFWCIEVMQWLNTALQAQPALRLILVTGQSDQLDGRLADYRTAALMDGLLRGLSEAQKARISILQRDAMVHAKTALIDDRWAIIGSANLACRSLFTDIEHSIAVADPAGQLVKEYRATLWGMHWRLPASEIWHVSDLEVGLKLWYQSQPDAQANRAFSPFHNLLLDLPSTRPTFNIEWQQMIEDPDSRQPWYFPLRAYFQINRRSRFPIVPGYANRFNAVSTRG